MKSPVVITVQDRGRVNLGKLARHERYFAHLLDDGSILLEPAVLVSLAHAERLGVTPGDDIAPLTMATPQGALSGATADGEDSLSLQ